MSSPACRVASIGKSARLRACNVIDEPTGSAERAPWRWHKLCPKQGAGHRSAAMSARSVPTYMAQVAAADAPPEWTLDQIAGLAFGGLLLASYLLSSKVDEVIARGQREELGLCVECGGLNDVESCDVARCPMKTDL